MRARFRSNKRLTVEEILLVRSHGVVGLKEARNIMAIQYPAFAKARDNDLDELINDMAGELGREQLVEQDINEEDEY